MYSIKVLSDKEFEDLPYQDLDTSLGVADPRTKTAYVRYTGINEVDKYLVNHELEHLIEGAGGVHSDHYRNGVYYKDFGQMSSGLGSIMGPLLMSNPATLGLGLGVAGAGGAGQMFGQQREAKKQAGIQAQQQADTQAAQMSALNSFQQPQISAPASPNVINPMGSTQPSEGGAGSPVDRVRAFFSGRSVRGIL